MKEGDEVWLPCIVTEGMFIDEYFVHVKVFRRTISFYVFRTSIIIVVDPIETGEGSGYLRVRILGIRGNYCRVLLPPLMYQSQTDRIKIFPCSLLTERPG